MLMTSLEGLWKWVGPLSLLSFLSAGTTSKTRMPIYIHIHWKLSSHKKSLNQDIGKYQNALSGRLIRHTYFFHQQLLRSSQFSPSVAIVENRLILVFRSWSAAHLKFWQICAIFLSKSQPKFLIYKAVIIILIWRVIRKTVLVCTQIYTRHKYCRKSPVDHVVSVQHSPLGFSWLIEPVP